MFVPETIDESVETSDGVFLRVGRVYVGLRSLGGPFEWRQTVREGFRKLTIESRLAGVAVEVGDEAEYGDFDGFRQAVSNAELDVSCLAEDKAVRYTTTRGNALAIQHNPDDWRPNASVNGTSIDYEAWPICESPYVTCRDGVMDVNDGRQGFSVDWRGELPEYCTYDVT